MHCKVIDKPQIDEWEEYVENNPTIAWQSYYWSEVVAKHYRTVFYPIAAFDDKGIRGVLPLYKMKTIKGKTNLISVPYAVGGGISADNQEAEKKLIESAIDLYQRIGADLIIFKQYKHKLMNGLSTDDNFYNRELDLTQELEKIYNGFEKANQENIRKAESLDLTLDYPSTELDQFYQLLLIQQKKAGVPCVSRCWIKDLIDFKMYSIALLWHKGRIVAGTLVKEHKKSVSFPFTAIPQFGDFNIMCAYHLYWSLLKSFKQCGKEIFHSGRIPNTDDAICYRLGWGGKKFSYYYQYYPQTTQSSEFKLKRGRKRQLVSEAWKRLPLGITQWLGPKVIRYFP